MAIQHAQIPLQFPPDNRFANENKDAKMSNVYIETQGGPLNHTIKRPGFSVKWDFSDLEPAEGSGDPEVPPRGIYRRGSDIYTVHGPYFYKNQTELYEITDGSTGTVNFDDFFDTRWIMKTTKGLYIIDDSDDSVTEITDQDYPDTTVDGVVQLNGIIYVMNEASEIQNSDSDDASDWDALDFIGAIKEIDTPIALRKQRDLVIAFCSRSIEFFFDAGNEPPGSPLSTQRNSFVKIGCPAADTIVETMNSNIFLAEDQQGYRFVAQIQGTSIQPVSTVSEDRYFSQEENIEDAYAWVAEADGHKFYILNLSTITLVYDIAEQIWYTWSTKNTNLLGRHSVKFENLTLVQDRYYVYEFSSDHGTDNLEPIQITIITPTFGGENFQSDFGMYNKMLSRLEFIGDYTGEGKLWISWSDDDHQTWSHPRCIDLHRRDFLTRCGRFQRRAFRLQTEFPNKIRFRKLELRMDVGSYGR